MSNYISENTEDVNVRFLKSESGDWIGMYINGNLVREGHSLSEFDVLEEMKPFMPSLELSSTTRDEKWFEEHGNRCPQIFHD